MQISGLIKNSFVDYPENLSIVIFTPFCNFDCFYCHNRDLIENPPYFYTEKEIFDFLNKRKNMIDHLVISGGEPTLQKDLKEFITKCKNLGYKIKLDSNGSNKDIIKDLINENLLDFIAIDYKAPLNKYKEICKFNGEKTLETINYLKTTKINFQVRTTLCPTLTQDDLKLMKKELGNIKNYVINEYRIPENFKEEDKKRIHANPINIKEID